VFFFFLAARRIVSAGMPFLYTTVLGVFQAIVVQGYIYHDRNITKDIDSDAEQSSHNQSSVVLARIVLA